MAEPVDILGQGEYPVPAVYLVTLQEFAAEKGIAPQDVLRGTGLPLSALLRPRARIGHLSMEQAVRNVADAIDDPALPVEYGKRLTIETHGALGFAAKNSASLADAMQLLVPYTRTRTGGQEEVSVLDKGDYACLRWSILGEVEPEIARFSALMGLVTIETIGRRLTGTVDEFIETEIRVAYESPGEIRGEVLAPGLKLAFEQPVTELRVPREFLERPLPHANPNLAEAARAQLEAELMSLNVDADVATIVRLKIRQSEGPLPTIEQVADSLHMSTRTLQRRLLGAGTTYQKIKDSERFRRAIHLMETTDDSLDRIAAALGYSDASNFTKAFKSWAGMSPGAYRAAL